MINTPVEKLTAAEALAAGLDRTIKFLEFLKV